MKTHGHITGCLYSIVCAGVLLLAGCRSENADVCVSSPDGALQVRCMLTAAGAPCYSVSRNGTDILLPSAMGLLTQTADLSDGFRWLGSEVTSHDETWETVWGEEHYIRDCHNQLTVRLQHASGTRMDILFRVFNDGFAFRYLFPDSDRDSMVVLAEHTQYVFARTPQAWSIPWRTEYYEALWTKAPISEKDTTCSPVTLELQEGLYAFLHEAALTDYPAQNFYYSGDTVRTFLTPWSNGVAAYECTPWHTPWRFMTLTDDLQGLMASRIMLNLNEPCRIDDTSWIRPMKFIGIWWGMHLKLMTWWNGPQHGATTATMKRYIDFAADNGFGGVLAEGWNVGWGSWDGPHPDERFSFVTPYADYDMDYLADYAHSRGVQIIFHHETAGDAANYENQLDTAYRYIEQYGMHAVKTGYVSPVVNYAEGRQYNRSQAGVRHYRRVIEEAAAHRVAIDNHEPVMPTGLQRTFPNLMTQEGIRGQEWNAWAADGGSPASHVATLPFTRMLAGPADYTPGVFNFANPVHPDTRVHATLANQLGLFVVLYSPLQMACDLPENYQRYPDAFRFIQEVPCDWERSCLLDGAIGQYVVMARQERGGSNWYVGAVNDDTPREVALDWSFLPDGLYDATLWRDAPDADWRTNPYAVNITAFRLRITDGVCEITDSAYDIAEGACEMAKGAYEMAEDACEMAEDGAASLSSVRMASGGGFAMSLHPVAESNAE